VDQAEPAAEFYDEMWQRYGHLDAASPAAFHRRRLIVELCERYAPGPRRVLRELCDRSGLEVLELWAWGFPFQNLYRSAVRVASRFSMGGDAPRSDGALSRVLGHGYALFGRALKPLFYLNRTYWGEQLLLVARRRAA
jgi:hypothetical protein